MGVGKREKYGCNWAANMRERDGTKIGETRRGKPARREEKETREYVGVNQPANMGERERE
jgi:hypothetical protein